MVVCGAALAHAFPLCPALSSSEAISQQLSWPWTIQIRGYFVTVKGIRGTYIYSLTSMGIFLSGCLEYSAPKKEINKVQGDLIKKSNPNPIS